VSRVVLVSGKGGVGKTTVAAATAVRAAELGHRTLVVSLDRAHNLGDVLGVALGAAPKRVRGVARLSAMEADPQTELGEHAVALQGYFAQLLEWAGIRAVQACEVAVIPGLEELLMLSRLAQLVESGDHDVIVVDLAPTASSLRILSFPELMAGPFGKLVQWERRFMKLARPAAKRLIDAPLPEEETYEALNRLSEQLGRLRDLLLDPGRALVRLVSIPERVVMEETRSAYTLLSLFGLAVDAVVLNRVLPDELRGGYLDAWTKIQAREIERAKEQLAGLAMLTLRFQKDEVAGAAALSRVAREIYGDADPAAQLAEATPIRFHEQDGEPVLSISLPHASADALDLRERDGELIITLGGWRRQLLLPTSLHGRAVTRARLAGGALHVHFEANKGGS
jgi:arsenite/tail-anchored protein-transporting ATPase